VFLLIMLLLPRGIIPSLKDRLARRQAASSPPGAVSGAVPTTGGVPA